MCQVGSFTCQNKKRKNMTYQQQLVLGILSHKAQAFSVHPLDEDDSTSLRYYPITYDFGAIFVDRRRRDRILITQLRSC